jgi:type I restriction enzyme S subunit
MAGEWRLTSLIDLIEVKHGFAFLGEFFRDEQPGDVLLTPGNFKIGGGFKADKLKYYGGPVLDEFVLAEDDLLVTMTDLSKATDTLGYPALVPLSVSEGRFLHNQRLGKVLIKPDAPLERSFLYYLLCSREYRNEIVASATGTTVKHTSPSRIQAFRFELPPLPEQRAIAHILGTLDDKIELNRRMNETLEAIARALFKSYFVDAAQTGLPEGWRESTIGEICEFSYGKSLKEEMRRPGSIPVYGSNGQVGWHDEALVKGPGIVVGRKGNPGIVTWSATDFFPIDTTFYVVPKGECRSLYFLLYALSAHDLASLGADSAVPGLNRNMAYLSAQILPPPVVQDAFDKQVRPLFERIHHKDKESRTLAALRDVLLPKLISGELRVRDAERFLTAAPA